MEKEFLLAAIDKFHLNGIIEKTKWNVKSEILNVKFVSPNKDMTGNVFIDGFTELANEDIAIFNISQLYKLIGITNKDLKLGTTKQHKVSTKLTISDETFNLEYALSEPMLIPKVPEITEPTYEFEFPIDKDLIENFIKARKAITATETVTVTMTFNDKGKGIITFIIGENNEYSNKVNFSIPSTRMSIPLPDMIFSIDYIREIFDVNKDLETGTGFINSDGLMKMHFIRKQISSTYFLIAK